MENFLGNSLPLSLHLKQCLFPLWALTFSWVWVIPVFLTGCSGVYLAAWRVNSKGDLLLQPSCVCVCVCEIKSDLTYWVTVFVCIQCVYVHTCVFDVLALCEDGWVSLSSTAAGKTSVAPHPLWADRRDCCMTSHWCLDDLRGHSLLSPSLSQYVCVQERISEFEEKSYSWLSFESNWDLCHSFYCIWKYDLNSVSPHETLIEITTLLLDVREGGVDDQSETTQLLSQPHLHILLLPPTHVKQIHYISTQMNRCTKTWKNKIPNGRSLK